VRLLICSSSLPNFEQAAWLKVVLGVPILESYSAPHVGTFAMISKPMDSASGHVGGVIPPVEAKLVDVSSVGYTTRSLDAYGHIAP
jgi:long-subunit acyl-CoA synthetase (AMP-forming)